MTKRQTKYIVKRNYDNRRPDTDAFLRLIKKSSKLNNKHRTVANSQLQLASPQVFHGFFFQAYRKIIAYKVSY